MVDEVIVTAAGHTAVDAIDLLDSLERSIGYVDQIHSTDEVRAICRVGSEAIRSLRRIDKNQAAKIDDLQTQLTEAQKAVGNAYAHEAELEELLLRRIQAAYPDLLRAEIARLNAELRAFHEHTKRESTLDPYDASQRPWRK